jgi:hypothetical protein
VFTQNAPPGLRSARPVITTSDNNTKLSVCVSGTMDAALVRVIGFSTLSVAACSEATRPTKQYIDIYLECAPFGGQRHAAVLTRRWAC